MYKLISRMRSQDRDSGFTLVELIVTVAIIAVIVPALAGVVLSYLRTNVDTQARMTESHDVQFAAAYWQRDVASIGVRSTTYDPADTVHSYPLQPSVDVTPSCTLPAGSVVTTLAWSSYTVDDPDDPKTVTVSYVATQAGARWTLTRVRCTDSVVNSQITVADNLTAKPQRSCPGAVDGCAGYGSHLPTVVTMTLTSNDPDGHDSNYSATLTGERRQS